MADDPAIANTDATWREMIAAAKHTVAIGQFYVSEKPAEVAGTDRLQPVIDELALAVKRGVNVRFLVDASFSKKYPASVERLRGLGVSIREFDAAKSMGGVLHAKYMVIDEEDAYFGSANFDWRSLDHIHELGLRVRSRRVAGVFLSAFDADWAASGGEAAAARALGDPMTPELLGRCSVREATSRSRGSGTSTVLSRRSTRRKRTCACSCSASRRSATMAQRSTCSTQPCAVRRCAASRYR